MSDPKMVLVWNKSLKCRKGKFAAQVAHASMAWLSDRIKTYEQDAPENRKWLTGEFTPAELEWLEGLFTKIVVGVESEEKLLEIYKRAKVAGLEAHLIKDAGLTEFAEPTYTAVGIGPDYADNIDPITGDLQLM